MAWMDTDIPSMKYTDIVPETQSNILKSRFEKIEDVHITTAHFSFRNCRDLFY